MKRWVYQLGHLRHHQFPRERFLRQTIQSAAAPSLVGIHVPIRLVLDQYYSHPAQDGFFKVVGCQLPSSWRSVPTTAGSHFPLSTRRAVSTVVPSHQPNLSFRYSDGGYVTSRTVTRGEELFINYDRDYYPGYTAGFRARESFAGDTV